MAVITPKMIGERVKRREDPRLIQGRATYVDDIKLPGMRHLAFKRSDIAHGIIKNIDVSAAAAMPGVEFIITGAELKEFLPPMPLGTPFPSPDHYSVAATRANRSPWSSPPTATSPAMPPTPSSSTTNRSRPSSIPKRR